MARNELIQRIDQALTAKIGRRSFLRASGLAATATVVGACFPGQKTEVPPSASAGISTDTGASTAPSASPSTKPSGSPVPTAMATEAPTSETGIEKPLVSKLKEGEAKPIPWLNGKYRTFDRSEVVIDGKRHQVLLQPDLGTLGVDIDVIFGIDFPGNIDTDAEVIYSPRKVEETRVIGIKRTDLTYVQFRDALGGDAFDEYKGKDFGDDEALAARARFHAENSAHTHQKVVYIGDLGLFQKQWGDKPKERAFLNRMIRAQSPSRVGIPESNFVSPRKY